MANRRVMSAWAAILLLLAGGAGVAVWWTPGVDVGITNDGDVPIRDVSLRFGRELKHIPSILPGHSVSVTIYPRGKCGLGLEFTRRAGDRRHGDVDVYLDQDYAGTVHLRVGRDGAITYWERTKIRWYFSASPRTGIAGTVRMGG
jgi:hypothetical protein